MRDTKRKVARQTDLSNPLGADDIKAVTARHVRLEQMRSTFGFEVE